MTIEEKAEEYRRDTFGTPFGKDIAMAFKDGAEWMLEKATEWLKNNAQFYYFDPSDTRIKFYTAEQLTDIFKKTMEK